MIKRTLALILLIICGTMAQTPAVRAWQAAGVSTSSASAFNFMTTSTAQAFTDLVGTTPGLTAAGGFTSSNLSATNGAMGNGTVYLTSSVNPYGSAAQSWTAIVRFTNNGGAAKEFFGQFNSSNYGLFLTGSGVYANGYYKTIGSSGSAGVAGVSGATAYLNGVSVGTGIISDAYPNYKMYIMAGNNQGSVANITSAYIQFAAFYPTTFSTVQMDTVMRAIAAFPYPDTVNLASPANGATNQATTLTLNWYGVSEETSYTMQVSTNTGFSTTVSNQTGLSVTTASVSGLTSGSTYYWHAAAVNSSGSGGWAHTWSFTVATAPGVPSLTSPSNGATNQSMTPTLTWSAGTGSPTSYAVQVSTVTGFSTTVYNNASTTTTSVTPTLTGGTTYYWQVNATNGGGTSAWTPYWSFTTATNAPSVPTLSAPASGSFPQHNSITLSWAAGSFDSSYNLLVSTSGSFANTFTSVAGTTSVSAVITGFSPSSVYYWRVNSANESGMTSSWTSAWSFSTPTNGTWVSTGSTDMNNTGNYFNVSSLAGQALAYNNTYSSTAPISTAGLTCGSISVTGTLPWSDGGYGPTLTSGASILNTSGACNAGSGSPWTLGGDNVSLTAVDSLSVAMRIIATNNADSLILGRNQQIDSLAVASGKTFTTTGNYALIIKGPEPLLSMGNSVKYRSYNTLTDFMPTTSGRIFTEGAADTFFVQGGNTLKIEAGAAGVVDTIPQINNFGVGTFNYLWLDNTVFSGKHVLAGNVFAPYIIRLYNSASTVGINNTIIDGNYGFFTPSLLYGCSTSGDSLVVNFGAGRDSISHFVNSGGTAGISVLDYWTSHWSYYGSGITLTLMNNTMLRGIGSHVFNNSATVTGVANQWLGYITILNGAFTLGSDLYCGSINNLGPNAIVPAGHYIFQSSPGGW
jgi:hypothetical protein